MPYLSRCSRFEPTCGPDLETAVGPFCLYPHSHYQDASARLGFVHIFTSRTENLLDAGSISHVFFPHSLHLNGGVINLADRCLLRRYKQPNNRVCSGCDGSRCARQKKTQKKADQQVFTKNETEWNQQFTGVHSAEGGFTDYSYPASVLFSSTAEARFTLRSR